MTIENNVNDEEKKAVDELKKRFQGQMNPKLYDDAYFLLRFLRARNMNVDNAETMLKKHLEFRKKYDIDDILNFKKLEVFEKYVPFQHLGFDKEGCFIRYVPLGNIDMSGVIASCTQNEMMKCVFNEVEYEMLELRKQSQKLGKNVDKCVYIYNFDKFSFAACTDKKFLQFGINSLSHYINNYPERLKAGFIINTPIYFNIVYSILKSLLPVTVLQKIRIYSDDSYKEDLLKLIDSDVLPKFLGGDRTDPDGNALCLTFIDHGGKKVPDSYHLSKNRVPLSKLPDAKKVTLGRAAFHEVNLEVKEPGSFLEWEFETKCRDIGFGVFYNELVDGEEKITELVPIQRIDTEEYPEIGTLRCDDAGTYVILFDNTYSWVRSKEIFYRAKVVSPKEKEAELKD